LAINRYAINLFSGEKVKAVYSYKANCESNRAKLILEALGNFGQVRNKKKDKLMLVTITYEKDGNDWKIDGFEYDIRKSTTVNIQAGKIMDHWE